MHPVRRRKKRPNYGVRTVEVSRGKNGFGFTISGQQPCILSCIVSGSPAERAGLRPGDYLVAVNGQSVSKLPHDDVVRLIGCLNGVLKLQIAENYYSDSSDEDHIVSVRSKPKFVHKPRSGNTNHRTSGTQPNRTSKVVKEHRTNTVHDKFSLEGAATPSRQVLNESWALPALPPQRALNAHHSVDLKEELCFVIGYLGTIEMPKQIQPGCRPQVVRGCVKRLRAEKRSHSWVLMRVHADGVTVAGSGGKILAEYPVNRITFCGPSSEEDKKYFGLVTTNIGDGNEVSPSSSCHVFAVQANLFEHQKHSAKASSFKITCTPGTLTQGCFEFPPTSEPILNAIKSFCLTKDEGNRQLFPNEMLLANSPQPSHSGSTAASSNSDSGIGFRDDCGNQSDRIVMVDVENQRLHIQQLYNNTSKCFGNAPNSLNIQLHSSDGSLETPSANLQHAFACVNALCPLPVAFDPLRGTCSTDRRLAVRAISDSKVPTSNRSRSPLNSSSSSSDDDKTLTKHTHLKNVSLRSKADRSGLCSSKAFASEDSSKSLPISGLWYEKSIFYQLGLLPDQSLASGKPKGIHDLSYKATSKSSDHLDHSNYYVQKAGSETTSSIWSKANSKSTDNLMQIGSGDYLNKNYKLSPQVNIGKCNGSMGGQKLSSPLSISYGEGSIVQLSRDSKQPCLNDEDISLSCGDKSGDELLTCSTTPNLNFGGEFLSRGKSNVKDGLKQNHFKSADDMSICSSKSNDALLLYKLSPKVFGVKRPLTTQSLEDLKGSDPLDESSHPAMDNSRIQQWGSLQDLRNFAPGSFEPSLMPKDTGFDEKESSEEDKNQDGVVSWSTSFEKLLEDPAGLNAFAEFLKKEFSQENIIFWVSCEKYKTFEDEGLRKKLASEIFETHLAMGATEPVNVDAHAHQYTQEKLSEAPVDLFVPAQKQIFNLMKFDSYPRFLKSDLYKECLLRELANEELPFGGNLELPPSLQQAESENPPNRGKLKKSRSDAEDCRRKSLLPWHRKNRSKSKDRGESEYKLSTLDQKRENEDVVSVRSEITSSRSSLASWDLALRGSFSRQSVACLESGEREERTQLCRVILPNRATTVVQVRPKETVRELIHRLLEKRGLQFSSFELYVAGSAKPLLLDEDATTLSNKEVRVEQRVVFRLDLPNRRTVSVKAKATKTLGQVLRLVLHKYSYRLETVTICSMSENEVLETNLPVTAVDGRRLTVLTRSTNAWKGESVHNQGSSMIPTKTFVKAAPTLDEITNKVFEEVLQGKSEGMDKSEPGSIQSEEWGSEHSSGIFGKFLRRDSAFHEKSRTKGRGGTGGGGGGGSRQILEGASKHVEGVVSLMTSKPPIISKWKSGGKMSGKSESDELYEGLKRAQKGRLEDQRGTEINFELPDFLKDKENAPQSGKKIRKFRREDGASTPKFYDMDPPPSGDLQEESSSTRPLKSSPRSEKLNNSAAKQQSETAPKSDAQSASARRLDYVGRTVSKPLTCKTYETPKTTTIKNELFTDIAERTGMKEVYEGNQASTDKANSPGKNEPPPLPPKPKYLPPKSTVWTQNNYTNRAPQEITNRGNNFLKPSDIKRDSRLLRSRRTIYLDQPSSSFV